MTDAPPSPAECDGPAPERASEPIMTFHKASAGPVDYYPSVTVGVLGGVLVVGMPIKWLIDPGSWPPELPLVGLWLLWTAIIAHAAAIPLLTTRARMRRGEEAGLRVAEGERYVEVAFFAGSRPKWVERFAYADIFEVGCDRFSIDPFGNRATLPYVATRGAFGIVKKNRIRLRGGGDDLRGLLDANPHRIAADIDRVVRRHVDLPRPEVTQSALGDGHDRDAMRRVATRWEKVEREREERVGRFMGVDWTRLALAVAVVFGAKLAFLNDLLGVRFLSNEDLIVTAIMLYFAHGVAGEFLTAWRRRDRAQSPSTSPPSTPPLDE